MVFLSVALLTKNSERTVKWALSSLLAQDILQNLEFELIIVDGYSKDATLNIVESYCEKLRSKFSKKFQGCRVYKEHVGVGFARNIALYKSHGEWILWLDSDIILGRDYISSFIESVSNRQYSKHLAVLYPRNIHTLIKNFQQRAMSCQSSIKLMDRPKPPLLPYTATQGVFTQRQALINVGGFNNKLIAAEDVDIYIKLLANGYTMESFDSILYVIPRKSFKEFFKQAMIWNYGLIIASSENSLLCIDMKTKTNAGLMAQLLEKKNYHKSLLPRVIARALRNIIKSLDDAVKSCGAYVFPAYIAFLYRQLGYLRGVVIAQRHLRSRQTKSNRLS